MATDRGLDMFGRFLVSGQQYIGWHTSRDMNFISGYAGVNELLDDDYIDEAVGLASATGADFSKAA
jgi:hypothetical protein